MDSSDDSENLPEEAELLQGSSQSQLTRAHTYPLLPDGITCHDVLAEADSPRDSVTHTGESPLAALADLHDRQRANGEATAVLSDSTEPTFEGVLRPGTK